MGTSVWRSTLKIPKKFVPLITAKAEWYPGHMNAGVMKMQAKLRSVDCIIEVHDSRIPFTGRNRNFRHLFTDAKPHILLLNKMDLSDFKFMNEVKETIMKEDGISHVIYTHCKDRMCKGIKKVIPAVVDCIKASDRYNRQEVEEYCLMVIGVPNVGKSSLINTLRNKHLRKGNAAKVGASAGVTRSVQEKIKVCEDPPIYLLDTPGIMEPSVKNYETGMKLALCASFPDHLIGQEAICDYLLYFLNKQENYSYVEHLGLDEPSSNVLEVLAKSAIKMNKFVRLNVGTGSLVQRPNLLPAATLFIKGFREGKYGPMLLDTEELENKLQETV